MAQEVADAFVADNQVGVDINIGSTGHLATQIQQGAPYDVLMAADEARPQLLEAAGRIVPGTRRTYAIGQLVFWLPNWNSDLTLPKPNASNEEIKQFMSSVLAFESLTTIAVANWRLAPYGEATRSALATLGIDLTDSATLATLPKLVLAENIGQVFTLLASGSVGAGFIAAAQLEQMKPEVEALGKRWPVPARLHTPIRQQMVLLTPAKPGARDFYDYVLSQRVQALIVQRGYEVVEQP